MGISDATFYNWRKKYGGPGPSELRRLKQLEEENAKLKRLVADLSLDKAMLQDVLAKNSVAFFRIFRHSAALSLQCAKIVADHCRPCRNFHIHSLSSLENFIYLIF